VASSTLVVLSAAILTASSFVYVVSLILIINLFIILVVFVIELCVKLCWLTLTSYYADCRLQLIIYTFKYWCWVEQYKPVFLYTFTYINKRVLKVIVSLVYLW
jgi:hypothetical protein